MTADVPQPHNAKLATIGKLVGLLLFVAILSAPNVADISPEAKRLAAVTVLMASLWLTQAIPIAATSLVPLVAFPLLGIQTADAVSLSYINKNIFLFLGGFVIALGIEKWGLHRRMALHIIRLLGTSLRRVILGFMLATAFLSMWISNTAATLLMLPIALALLNSLKELTSSPARSGETDLPSPPVESMPSATISAFPPDDDDEETNRRFAHLSCVLMLAIAYSASIGGFTSLVGTPTNVQFLQIWEETFPEAPGLSAGQWMTAVAPLGIVFIAGAWVVLTWNVTPLANQGRFNRGYFNGLLQALGRPTPAERRIFAVFATTAALWIFRTPLKLGPGDPILPGWGSAIEHMLLSMGANADMATSAVHDSTVAIGMALLLFFIPGKTTTDGRVHYLMDWSTAEKKLPWGILLLIGGGFALAKAFTETGLAEWIGGVFTQLVADWPPWLLVAAVCLMLTFLTEFTSNVATVSALLPILAETSRGIGVDPRLIMIPATIATSCAFMLPIATPPNAIVFGSHRVDTGAMARYGLILNLLGVVLITLATFFLFVPQFSISLDTAPSWSVPTD